MFDIMGWIFICIIVAIWGFTFGFIYQLSRLYKKKMKCSKWMLLRIKFRDMEKELLKEA